MSVDAKHIATFLLGAAAGVAAHKYMSMTPEEKEKLVASLKDKAHQFKNEAENAAEKTRDYFSELKSKGADALKEHLGDAEKIVQNIFGTKTSTSSSGNTPS
jgi:gas vesicle protein